ncbi:hypothetical protein BDB00DRAFT_817591 [Zychaea mexicana]|uniref:uncharacterized protein n=1 Tax=Zychaea mexicana TaxID=64656 RepID=UPI0022FEFC6C|nr:uncharacterized protein BDB00DRAFT_817591 [Zychaea mexicana]KAI9494629.1 hypothetical protein BDB00DRAFT_817591 [Zychaea mexicana]
MPVPTAGTPSSSIFSTTEEEELTCWDYVRGAPAGINDWIALELDRIERQVLPRHCKNYAALANFLESMMYKTTSYSYYCCNARSQQDDTSITTTPTTTDATTT